MITLFAFGWVPPFAQGLVRDLRVRWALEEAGLPYEERLLAAGEKMSPEYRAVQPFGQVPAYQEDGLSLFESGAILLHVAKKSEALMPSDPGERAVMTSWMFAALNTVEPHVQNLAGIDLFHADDQWAQLRRPAVLETVEKRLDVLAEQLERRDYLLDRFTAADLLMSSVLRILRHTDLVAQRPALEAFQQRCEGRPAFGKALADQMAAFARNEPAPV